MSAPIRKIFSALLGVAILASLGCGLFLAARFVWRALIGANPDLAVALVAAGTTLIATAITVMLGRYFERQKEIEAHFRADKIRIYDEFIEAFLKFSQSPDTEGIPNLTEFLRNWQRKVVLWGGPAVLKAYFDWMNRLKRGQPDAQTVFLMDDFFRALRADIGQSSHGLPRGAFANLLLRRGDFFLEQAAKDPKITLEELAKLEKARFGDDG